MQENDTLIKKALKAIAEEELSVFIDSKNISEDELKEALLTAVDINILCDEYQHNAPTDLKKNKINFKEKNSHGRV